MARAKVNLEVFEGRLRLRWRHEGRRYCLALGVSDRPVNRLIAEQKAKAIEADIVTGNFDATLSKYRAQNRQAQDVAIADLFDQFQAFKVKTDISRRTLDKYKALRGKLVDYFGQRKAVSITREDGEQFRTWLLKTKQLSPTTAKTFIGLLKAAYQWGVQKKLVTENPFAEVRVKVFAAPPPAVFSAEEREQVINAFRKHPVYYYFADYVEFSMFSGCRPAEVIGLRWQSVSADCAQITIWESLSRGVRKETKTNRTRSILVGDRLQMLLVRRKAGGVEPGDLVFPSLRGGPIDDHNFRNRAWKKVLDELGIDYRKPYTTRHTAHSHLLDQGWSPAEVAEAMGNSVQVVYQHYAANVKGRRKLPD